MFLQELKQKEKAERNARMQVEEAQHNSIKDEIAKQVPLLCCSRVYSLFFLIGLFRFCKSHVLLFCVPCSAPVLTELHFSCDSACRVRKSNNLL